MEKKRNNVVSILTKNGDYDKNISFDIGTKMNKTKKKR